MDNAALKRIIDKIPFLKHRYLGSFPADLVPYIGLNKFVIVNTEPSDCSGEHWILFANKNGVLYFGDSLGKPLQFYTHLSYLSKRFKHKRLIKRRVQSDEPFCGLYAIYIAWSLYNRNSMALLSDYYVLRFMSQFL